jgi:hypothetical protein
MLPNKEIGVDEIYAFTCLNEKLYFYPVTVFKECTLLCVYCMLLLKDSQQD